MKQTDACELAYKNGHQKGYVEGWNEAIDYIYGTLSIFVKKRGINTDNQKINTNTEEKSDE